MRKYLLGVLFCLFASAGYGQAVGERVKLAKQLVEEDKYTEALDVINDVLAVDSTNYDYYLVKANCQASLKNYLGAIVSTTKALALAPENDYLYGCRANVLLRIGHFDEAIEDFNAEYKFAKADSSRRFALCNRATAKAYKRDFAGAYEDLVNARKLDTTDIALLINIAAVSDQAGKPEETIWYLKAALRLDSTSEGAYSNLGFTYQRRGDHKTAIMYFDKMLSLYPKQPLGYSNRSLSRLKTGDVEGAMSDINTSLDLYPTNSYAYCIRAQIYIAMNNLARACLDLETALDQHYTTSYGSEAEDLQRKYCEKK